MAQLPLQPSSRSQAAPASAIPGMVMWHRGHVRHHPLSSCVPVNGAAFGVGMAHRKNPR